MLSLSQWIDFSVVRIQFQAPGSEMFDSSCHVLAGFVHGE